ncbi:MAG: response regulator [Microcoleaceae cyanobacterium]
MSLEQADILIIDDTPENLKLLSSVLQSEGYRVRKLTSGKRVIQAIDAARPDLILLDIMMPDMNGYQVAQLVQQSAHTRDIPIIFLSALSDTADKVLAFDAGGVDYITKPFQVQEVLVRVRTQLALQYQRQQLIQKNEQLQQEIQERRKVEAELRVYIRAVSHDLRNPVTGMRMVLESLSGKVSPGTPQIPVKASIIQRMAESCERQLHLINSLVETSELELRQVPINPEPLDLDQFTQKFLSEWKLMLEKYQITVENLVSDQLPQVQADSDQLWRVLDNLVSNAIKYNPPGITLTLAATHYDTTPNLISDQPTYFLRYTVSDDGVGLSCDDPKQLFERYRRGEGVGKIQGLGLGLYLCRQIIAAHGGQIGATDHHPKGATFWFTLPAVQRPESQSA